MFYDKENCEVIMVAPKGNKFGAGNHNAGVKKVYTTEFIENEAKEFIKWAKKFPPGKPLFFKRFALERDYLPRYLSEWANQNQAFKEALEFVKGYQESEWVENAMTDNYNQGFVRFCLKNHHGYKEEEENSGKQVILKLSNLE